MGWGGARRGTFFGGGDPMTRAGQLYLSWGGPYEKGTFGGFFMGWDGFKKS